MLMHAFIKAVCHFARLPGSLTSDSWLILNNAARVGAGDAAV